MQINDFQIHWHLIPSESGDVYVWGYGPLGTGPEVTFSKEPLLVPPTLFGRNELSPDAKVRRQAYYFLEG